MEAPSPKPDKDYHATVDTSRPFRSVKEAIAIFGERILVGEIYTPKPYAPNYEASWRYSPAGPSPTSTNKDDDHHHDGFLDSLKKLESELEETKMELKLLKERESETEIALASLNAELHKNMSKLAEAEAAAAAAKKAAVATRTASFEKRSSDGLNLQDHDAMRRELMLRMEGSPTLAQILSLGEGKGYFGGRKKDRKMMKKKPIIPLVGDLFFRKKGSSATLNNPLYTAPQPYFN